MVEVKLIWSKEALKDIEKIISYISKDSNLYADTGGGYTVKNTHLSILEIKTSLTYPLTY